MADSIVIYLLFVLTSFSFIAPQCSLQVISKKHENVLWLSISPKLPVQNKFPRDVVVRSELTAAGSAGDGYSLPGMYETKMSYLVRFYNLCLSYHTDLISHVLIFA